MYNPLAYSPGEDLVSIPYDSKRFNDCKRQGADQSSTRAGWPVPLLFTPVSVENHRFSNIL